MRKQTKSKELDTHVDFFGGKCHVVLLNTKSIKNEDVIKILVKALKCAPSYAKECLKEVEDLGESYILASNYERCELTQELLKRSKVELLTKLIKDT